MKINNMMLPEDEAARQVLGSGEYHLRHFMDIYNNIALCISSKYINWMIEIV